MPNGATLLADTLAHLGFRDVLGIPGAIDLPFYDALYGRADLRPFLVRQEQAASFAADGFGKVTGRPAVCLAVPGPGATNLSTGVATALGDSVPLIAITVQVPAERRDRHAIHDLDVDAIYRPMVKQQFRVAGAEAIPGVIRQAYAASLSGRPGPVQVLLPADLLSQTVASEVTDPGAPWPAAPDDSAMPADPTLIDEAVEMLAAAGRLMIYAGAGALGAREQVLALAERLDAPVVTSFCGRGLIPEDHPRCVGPASFPGAADVIAASDTCLAVGTCFSESATRGWRDRLPEQLIHVDMDPAEFGRSYPARIGIRGDAQTILKALLAAVPKRSDPSPMWSAIRRAQVARAEEVAAVARLDPGWPLHPAWVARAMRETCPAQTIFTADASSTKNWLFEPFFPLQQPRRLLTPDVFQPMGYALPAAIGARLAEPDSPVVAVTGDGSLMMALAELSTAVTAGLALVVVVFNDGLYNALRLYQERRFGGRFIGVNIAKLNYARLATEFGAEGIAIGQAGDLRPALEQAIAADRVTLIDVPIDPRHRSSRYR